MEVTIPDMEFGITHYAYFVSVYFQNLLKGTKHVLTPNMNERKWRQPRLQLHLVTKSRGRRELGLPTSFAAVLPLKMMPCMMF